jgi:hypothetical protein
MANPVLPAPSSYDCVKVWLTPRSDRDPAPRKRRDAKQSGMREEQDKKGERGNEKAPVEEFAEAQI